MFTLTIVKQPQNNILRHKIHPKTHNCIIRFSTVSRNRIFHKLNVQIARTFWVPSGINFEFVYHQVRPFQHPNLLKHLQNNRKHHRRKSSTSPGPRAEPCREHFD